MTLSSQNKLLLWFSSISTLICLALFIGIITFANTNMASTQNIESSTLLELFIVKNTGSVLLPYMYFTLYVPIVGFTIYFSFEKTKSPEILYFITMLIGFFAQSFLLCIPIFSLHKGYTLFLNSISSLAFFGQIQVILSILFQGVLVTQDESRDTDRYVGIISVAALAFAAIIPLDFTTIEQDFLPTYGFESVFSTIRIVFILVAFVSMILSPASKKSTDYKKASISFFLICVGYTILLNTSTLLSFSIGSVLFTFGTVRFLKRLHWHYMWK